MTIEVERDALLSALRQVADVVEARTTIPVLSNILLIARDGELTVTGTDLDIEASASLPAAGDLETTVDARKLVAGIASLKPGRVVIAPTTDRSGAVTIKGGRSVRTLGSLSAIDFPKRKEPEAAQSFTMAAATLARMLTACHVAQSTDETRYYLCGVYLHLLDGKMSAAATDGVRLVRAQASAPDGTEGMPQVILPSKAVALLRKMLGKASGEIALSVAQNAVQVSAGGMRLIFKTVDGTFPDYARVIPAEADGAHRMVVARDALLDAVNGVTAVMDAEGERKSRRVRFDLTPDAEVQTLSARDTAGSAAVDEVEAAVDGGAISIELDQRYLISALGTFADGGELTMHFVGDSPTPVRLTSDKDPDLVAVIQSIGVGEAR
ncbi:hypothetical protein ASE95_02880 [Sphingomonas sp. Leaf231]|uniref:DNA polymerase III subunit beta n=1 Tax=Sphingomonas sp. Leaf231 TaxID=1736301 RepID=UPI0006F5873C|nr:DNA polymerase III subunit beta [Sphingomonas sp. Leaf231]KQN93865.1 hypothetical protein ASE95_02880 [Sphingomonas sp. Leaf231]